jgi:hypothetical protein
MSKKIFVETIDRLFQSNEIPAEALQYFQETVKAVKVNKREIEKAEVVKGAIFAFLMQNPNMIYDRVEIGNALYDQAEFAEDYIVNEKGTVAFNSITAFANQLVNERKIVKKEVQVGKVKKVKYGFII